MIRTLFLIRSLHSGGAERQLTELVRTLDQKRFKITVATFYAGGSFWKDAAAIPGVRLVSLEKQGRWDMSNFLRRALRLVREVKPDVLYSFAQAPNLVALLLGRVLGVKVVWSIRRSTKELPRRDWLAMASFWIGLPLSGLADRVVYNSHCGRDLYVARGFCARTAVVIPNGFDPEHFRPDAQARQRQRQAWGISDTETVVGIVGRLDPVQDHPLFLKAAAQVVKACRPVRFVCVGGGPEAYATWLRQESERLGLGDQVLWVGQCSDMPAVYNALDILTLCSKEEGCPNVVGEAMACGVPCVVTDAGDAAYLVGDSAHVTPPGDHLAMTNAIKSVLQLNYEERKALGQRGRQRIITEFSLSSYAHRTEKILEDAVSDS